jgi:hypothetical protein
MHARTIDLKENFPIDSPNCTKLIGDLRDLQLRTGRELRIRIGQLFPTRWLPELGPEGFSEGVALPSVSKTKKRKAEAEQPIGHNSRARKRTRAVTFAEPSRKSSRMVKVKILEMPAHEDDGAAVTRINKYSKTAKIKSTLKKATVVTTKTKLERMETAVTNPSPLPSDPRTRSMRSLPKRKADATLPPLTSTPPSKPPSLTLVTPQSLNRSTSAELGSPGSSTAVSPVSGNSRGSSTSAGTAVASPAMDSNNKKGKRKRVDEPEDSGSRNGEVGEVVVSRRTTRSRATKLVVKAVAAISNYQPVEDGSSRRKRKPTNLS